MQNGTTLAEIKKTLVNEKVLTEQEIKKVEEEVKFKFKSIKNKNK